MGLFDLFSTEDEKKKDGKKRDSWDHGIVSERHFGRDRFGYFHDEEKSYDKDETFDDTDW